MERKGLTFKKAEIVWVLLLFFLIFSPILFASGYRQFQLTLICAYSIALLGVNLLVGYNGQFSLGQSVFYALGGYTAAIMAHRWGIGYFWTLPVAGILAFCIGFLVGIPALRLEGMYIAITTYGLVIATPPLLKYFENWTGGVGGIILTKPQVPFGLPLNQDQWLYLVAIILTTVLFLLGWNLVRARPGRAIVAIRDNQIAAAVMGINVSLYKTITFGISAAYAGIAGVLGTIAIQFIAPDQFSLVFAISLLAGIVVGGLSTISGCIYGAFFILFIPNISEGISKSAPEIIYGTILILCMYVMPKGLSGFISKVIKRFRG